MSEPFVGNEMSEELESTEDLSREALELNEITNEPESYVEGKIEVAQSEAIESSFNELVNNQVAGEEIEMPALDGSSKPELESKDEVSNDSVPLPDSTEEGNNNPVPLPGDSKEGVSSTMESTDEGSIAPVPLPVSPDEGSIDPRPIIMEAGEGGEEEESFVKGSEEPAPLNSLDDLQSLALQQQITQNTGEFTIVSVIMHSSGDTAKNSINNIR